MAKKLKLRIAKFNKMLVVEQLELEGEFKETDHVRVHGDFELFGGFIDLQENIDDRSAHCREFDNNAERDEYAAKLVKWITEEQFGGVGKLEVGKPCLVKDYEYAEWEKCIYVGKLSQNIRDRDALFLTESEVSRTQFVSWKYAKHLNSAQPKIDGEIYTWEGE
ncbi:MAG: hypothetical protein J6R08_01075 [Opitutales bacterium]|nr:hypothetical protein [Opitutales bacterium]